MKKDVTKMMAGAENLIAKSVNPRHIAILRNYRRHAMLEVSGLVDEIFAPEMTVENPRYVSYMPNGSRLIMNGMAEVKEHFYGQIIRYGANVMILEDEHIAVDDWGLASEYLSNDYINYRCALERGFDVKDENAMYLNRRAVIMTWRYSDDCRLIGEHVSFENGGTIEKLAPQDVVTVAEARRLLSPIWGPLPPRLDRSGRPLAESVSA